MKSIRATASLALLLAAAGSGCAGPTSAARVPESAVTLAIPERDPANQGTPRERPLVSGLEQSTTAASVNAERFPIFVRVLAPELTAAGADDVRRAFVQCPWAPPPERTGLAERIAVVRPRPAVEPRR